MTTPGVPSQLPTPRQPGEGSFTLARARTRLPDSPFVWNPRTIARRDQEQLDVVERAANPLPESLTQDALSILDEVNKGRETNLVSWKDAAYNVARMFNTEDEKARDEAIKFINQYREYLRPEFLRIGVNIDEIVPEPEDEGILDKAKGAVAGALDVLDVPSQIVLETIGTIRQGLGGGGLPRTGTGTRGVGGDKEDLDKDKDQRINFREALGIDPEAGGRLAGALDTAAVIATDPTTYITLGTGAAAKSAVRTAVAELGDDAARRMVTRGMKALSKEEQAAIKRGFLREAEETALTTGRRAGALDMTKTADRLFKEASDQLNATLRVGSIPVVPRRVGGAVREALNRPIVPVGRGVRAGLVPELPRFARGITGSVPARQSLVDIVRESTPLTFLRNAFVPRSRLAGRVGQMAADEVYDVASLARSTHENLSHDTVRRLVGPMHELQKSLQVIGRKTYDDTLSIVQEALDSGFTPGMLDELRALDIPERSIEPLAKLLGVIEDVRSEVDQFLVGHGLPGMAVTQPKILTEDGIQTVLRNPDKAEELFGIKLTKGRIPRPIITGVRQPEQIADESIRVANSRAVEAGLMSTGESMFQSDLLKAIALRNDEAYHQAAQNALVSRLANMVDDMGHPMMFVSKPSDVKAWEPVVRARGGYVEFELEALPHLKMWVKDEMREPLERALAVTYNEETLKQWRRFMRGWSNLWASYATVPLVGGFGFHARNFMGNVYLSFLAGMKNPLRFAEAGTLQAKYMSIRRMMAQEGLDFETAALRLKGVTRNDVKLLMSAREDGILNTGFFADLDRDEELVRSIHRRLRNKVNPFSPENVVVRMGRSAGEAIENNARLALYLDRLAATGSRKQARATVRKFLFDYRDLTPFEVDVRNISRFYTFMRKNLGAHYYALGHNPGRVFAAGHVQRELTGSPDAGEGRMLPAWAQAASLGVGPLGGTEVMAGLDTPLGAAIETATLPLAVLSLAPGLQDHIPEWMRAKDKSEVAERVLGLTSGPTIELFTTLMEIHSGVDMFTGADISDENAFQTLKRLSNSVFPVVGKVFGDDASLTGSGFARRLVDGLSEIDDLWDADQHDTDALRLLYLRDLLGIQAHDVDKYQKGLQYQGVIAIDNAQRELQRRGVNVPTLNELRDAGLVPLQDPIIDILTNENLDDEGKKRALIKTLSKEQLEVFGPKLIELGINPEELEAPDVPKELQDARADVRAAADMSALEILFGRQLTNEERMMLMLASPDNPLGLQDLEGLGIEGLRPNQFAPKAEDKGPDTEAFLANAARFGFELDEIRVMRPALTDAERTARDAEAAGMSPDEVVRQLMEKYISRKEQNLLMGTESLPTGRYSRMTPDEVVKLRASVQRQLNEAQVLGDYAGYALTPGQQLQFLVWNNLTQDELEMLGMDKSPKTPTAKDLRTDDEKFQDALLKLGAITGQPLRSWEDVERIMMMLG